LTKAGWSVSLEYSTKLFDKGIGFDLWQLNKNGKKILFAWTNWFEGELRACSGIGFWPTNGLAIIYIEIFLTHCSCFLCF